ncbi:MAG: hypothetical protein EOO26_01275 [Comamonadaceae bacterium]|nr:MAG: hypothetical protein EOO26_01275 [Comamonadaceae bacterium]
MQTWFADGRIIDVLIAFTLLEGLALLVHHRMTGLGVRPRDFLANLVSGLCLMCALRAALAGAVWPWIAVWLAAAGLAHGFDLVRRWRRR